ncbi:hypothetical protein [Akkermansia sp. KLE1798]|uniref:hypothetical protein n=2 Tax=unclassified Akkermansia TaxID=2608915 RepID=UPI0007A8A582|nr:hypothetical protein [Akkermansia sp. KLE1798]KZA05146.1 hypothetical protein HMPREF1326_01182 [Akkermansia sp. KLE1605]
MPLFSVNNMVKSTDNVQNISHAYELKKRLPHQTVPWQHTGKITTNHAAAGSAPLTPAS